VGLARQAVGLGFDAVMADFSASGIDRNIRETGRVCALAAGTSCLVEGESAAIPTVDAGPAPQVKLSTAGETAYFADVTGVDLVAPALGTVHGFLRDPPRLDGAAVGALADAVDRPLVAHGCDFLPPSDLARLAASGVAKLNFGPQLRVAVAEGLSSSADSFRARAPDHRIATAAARDAVAAETLSLLRTVYG
jgi:fructose/tagatose bisphosphate aldolase